MPSQTNYNKNIVISILLVESGGWWGLETDGMTVRVGRRLNISYPDDRARTVHL